MKRYSPVFIILIVVVIILLVGWGFYEGNLNSKKPIPTPTTSGISVSFPAPSRLSDFSDSSILKKIAFVDSKGKNKLLIVLKTGGDYSGIPVVDTYIVDENLLKATAVKVPVLSGQNSLLNYSITDPQSVLISISRGLGKRYIIVSFSEEEVGSFMTLIDENGQVISHEVAELVFPLVKDKCQCGFKFGAWKDQDKFYVIIPSAKGTYRVLIDAKTGRPMGTPEGV